VRHRRPHAALLIFVVRIRVAVRLGVRIGARQEEWRARGGPGAAYRSALWTAYGALAARNLPFTALPFLVFERFRSALTERRRRETGRDATLVDHGPVTAVAAGSAGALAAAVTTPVDVIKTRIMLAAGDGARRGSMAFARDVVREQGRRGLFRGGALRRVWTMLGSGLYLGVYESARMYLVQMREE
jgi:solute carrier family 25 S-adenosylmethionine transporter 26